VSRSVTVQVPVRVCDVGGWTDTWFAGHGRVCSLAVEPGVTVEATSAHGDGRVVVEAIDFGVTFTVGSEPAEHRLIADAVREAGEIGPLDVHLRVSASVPPSSSFGTRRPSASVRSPRSTQSAAPSALQPPSRRRRTGRRSSGSAASAVCRTSWPPRTAAPTSSTSSTTRA
jgi:D-glycero-alpha-D-manno-heptose-7-phosphate kinase